MGVLHQAGDVRAQALAQEHVLSAHLVERFAVGPDLVRAAGCHAAAAHGAHRRGVRLAVAVQAHDRAERAVLEPAREHLAERFVVRVAAVEAADVGRPPRDARDAHVQARGELVAEALKARVDVAGPDERAVLLRAGPRAAQEVQNILLPLLLHALIEGLGVALRVDVADLHVRPEVVAVVVEIVIGVLRLGLIQPEHAHALVVVVFLHFVPDEFARLGVRRVVVDRVVHAVQRNREAALDIDEQAALAHLCIVRALVVDGRPDRDHQLDAHLLQLADHRVRVWPVLRVEAPLALERPVEEVDDDDGDRQAAALVLARHLQKLLLRLVAQLALPEAHRPVRHHRDGAGHGRVRFLDLRRGVARGDPVVDDLCGNRAPRRHVRAEGDRADARVVPQEAVAERGEHERDARL